MSMARSESAAIIVRSIVNLGHSLGFAMVAEGVESRESYDTLRDLGCEQVQGYFIGRPMPPEALGDWLREDRWQPTGLARASRNRAGTASDRRQSPSSIADAPPVGT
jgi:predicted signal transduction protein with EAL and GGDEF domain